MISFFFLLLSLHNQKRWVYFFFTSKSRAVFQGGILGGKKEKNSEKTSQIRQPKAMEPSPQGGVSFTSGIATHTSGQPIVHVANRSVESETGFFASAFGNESLSLNASLH